jgi:putative ABC transport system permease protein
VEIVPILSALRRNRVGAILIAMQIALTLAIVCNSLSIIRDRLSRMNAPTGIDEANIITLSNVFVGNPANPEDLLRSDLAVLRSLPGVVDAAVSNSFPLRGGGWSNGVQFEPNQAKSSAHTTIYFVDEHTLNAWGFHLVAGRWFTPDEIGVFHQNDTKSPTITVITQSLARQLYPDGNALGKTIYLDDTTGTRIIGVVSDVGNSWGGQDWANAFANDALFAPYLFAFDGGHYVIRTQPGQQAAVLKTVKQHLLDIDHKRVIDDVRPFSETRAKAYQDYRALSLMLGTVCALLLTVTAFGIVGLTTYWVAQRRRQIGVRRALGARRVDILRYFQIENLLIAGAGGLAGIVLALAGNLWLVTNLQMARMGVGYVLAGAAIVLGLSQAATLYPAMRAAALPPAMATRNV